MLDKMGFDVEYPIEETPKEPEIKKEPTIKKETIAPVKQEIKTEEIKTEKTKPEKKEHKSFKLEINPDVKEYISENLTFFIGGMVCILIVLVVAVFAAINWGDMKTRVVRIREIYGEVTIEADSRTKYASKNLKLASGDIITLKNDSRVRLQLDPDKFLTIEPDSSLYIDYTNIENMGSITINLLYGSAVVEMSNEIGAKDSVMVVTPNAMIDARKSVFRTTFEYFTDYGGFPAKITDIENLSGNLNIQLFDDSGIKSDNPMILKEGNFARLITTPETAIYGGLNNEIILENFSQFTLTELLRIQNSFTPLSFTTIELNDALKIVSERNFVTTPEVTLPETVSTTPFEPIILPPVTLPPDETYEDITFTTPSETSPVTLPTTQTIGEMTEYTGAKWWEVINSIESSDETEAT
ncbi:MAG: hypothetical protein LBM41_00240 [Ruminococcus sp.]|nr:hypothetical protein [Ruminococcus sp.]